METNLIGNGEERSVIIYHGVDLDGVASAAIVDLSLKMRGKRMATLRPYNYGQAIPDVTGFDNVYILDVSFGKDTADIIKGWKAEGRRVIWIDHHKTSLDIPGREDLDGTVIEVGKAACELTWGFAMKGKISPIVVKYLGAYDVWDHDRFDWDKAVLPFQYGMRARVGLCVGAMMDLIEEWMKMDNPGSWLSRSRGLELSWRIIDEGKAILHYIAQKNAGELDQFAFEATVAGYRALCMNTTEFNSTTFDNMWDENEFDLMMPFCFNGNGGFWRCSLYTTKDIDCGEIAKGFGGGGHAKAAGFQLDMSKMMDFLKTKELWA